MTLKWLQIAHLCTVWQMKSEDKELPSSTSAGMHVSDKSIFLFFIFVALLYLSKWPWKCGSTAFGGSQVNLSKVVNVQTLNPQVIKINCSYYSVTRLRWKFLSERNIEGHAITSSFQDKISITGNPVFYQNKVLFLIVIKSPSLKILTLVLHLPLGWAISFSPLICVRYTIFIFILLNFMFQRP